MKIVERTRNMFRQHEIDSLATTWNYKWLVYSSGLLQLNEVHCKCMAADTIACQRRSYEAALAEGDSVAPPSL